MPFPVIVSILCRSVVEPPLLEQGQSMGCPWCSDAHPAECLNFQQGEQVSLTPPPICSQQSAMDDLAWCHHYTRENCTQHCHNSYVYPSPPPPFFLSPPFSSQNPSPTSPTLGGALPLSSSSSSFSTNFVDFR